MKDLPRPLKLAVMLSSTQAWKFVLKDDQGPKPTLAGRRLRERKEGSKGGEIARRDIPLDASNTAQSHRANTTQAAASLRVQWLDFHTPLSSITILIPLSPLPSSPHSWLPSTNPPYFTSASWHFISSPLPLLLPSSLHLPPPLTHSSYICL